MFYFLRVQIILFGSMHASRWFALSLTCLKNLILFFCLAKVIRLHINLFCFIRLHDSHWNLSGKWGVTTFEQVFMHQA